jgi:hypothetical protein
LQAADQLRGPGAEIYALHQAKQNGEDGAEDD